jgi:hypothetical protein
MVATGHLLGCVDGSRDDDALNQRANAHMSYWAQSFMVVDAAQPQAPVRVCDGVAHAATVAVVAADANQHLRLHIPSLLTMESCEVVRVVMFVYDAR